MGQRKVQMTDKFNKIPAPLLQEAKILLDPNCNNIEYLRGICELLSIYVPTTEDNATNAIEIAKYIGINEEVANRMYN